MADRSISLVSAFRWPLGAVTVDVDGLWALRECYGQPLGDSFARDPVWDEGIPWLLDQLDSLKIRATFFVVARDLEVDSKRQRAEEIVRRGHEIGNHSLAHRIGLTRLPMGELLEDLQAAQEMFQETVYIRPVGFRAPGYDVDARLLRAVRRVGFEYDSSLLPTFWSPALRMADWWVARHVSRRKRQFGRLSYGWAPLRPYHPDRYSLRHEGDDGAPGEEGGLPDFLEIPIGVTPRLRLPVGAGYVLMAGRRYFLRALRRLESRGLPFVYVIHGADVTDLRKGDARVFPSRLIQPRAAGLGHSGVLKRRRIAWTLKMLSNRMELRRLADWRRDQEDGVPRTWA